MNEAQGVFVLFDDQEAAGRIVRRTLKPIAMLVKGDFMFREHVLADVRMVAPGENVCQVACFHSAEAAGVRLIHS